MDKEYFMKLALKEAKKAYDELEIPVGAIVVKDGKVIAKAYNEKEKKQDSTKHAEILAIQKASKKLQSWRLYDCDMYVTLEPCPMCAWAILSSRLDNLYFGSYDSLYGAFTTMPELVKKCNAEIHFKGGILESQCDNMLSAYFKKMRK